MMHRRLAAFAILLGALASACAQDFGPLPETVDLPAVLRLVREASPRLAIEREAVAGAEANRVTAGAYPNPTLNYGRSQPSAGQATQFDGSRQQQATIEVPLLIAGQRAARVEKAEREIEAARARVAAGASSLAAEAGAAFVVLLAAQEKAELLSSVNDELARLRNIVAGREASGMASRYDLTRLEVEVGGLRAKLDEAQAEISDRAGNLASLLGLQNWRPKAAGRLSPMAIDPDTLARLRERAESTPAVIAAIGEERVAQSGIEVARRERWPIPSLSAGRAWTSEPFGATNFLGLSIEIPILDTRRGPLAKAESDARTAALRRKLATAESAATLERLAKVIGARQSALQRFEQDASTRLGLLKQMAEDAYRLGRSSIFELLDSLRSRYELQQTHLELVAALSEAQVRFLAASGEFERSGGAMLPGPIGR